MSKVLNPYGTDNVVKKNFAKTVIDILYRDFVPESFDTFETKRMFFGNFYLYNNALYNNERKHNPVVFEKKVSKFIPFNQFKNNGYKERKKIKIVYDLIKFNSIISLYNYGKIPKNLNAKLYKSVKLLFKDRNRQKEIIDMLNNSDYSVKEISDKIYDLLKEEGHDYKEISLKIKNINQILRIKRIRDFSNPEYKDERKEIKSEKLRFFLKESAKNIFNSAEINYSYEDIRKMMNIIKSYSTYSLNMPLFLKIKKTFNIKDKNKIKKIINEIKNISEEYNIEEALINQKMEKYVQKTLFDTLSDKQKIKEFSLLDNIVDIMTNQIFENVNPETLFLNNEYKFLIDNIDYCKHNFIDNQDIGKKYYKWFYNETFLEDANIYNKYMLNASFVTDPVFLLYFSVFKKDKSFNDKIVKIIGDFCEKSDKVLNFDEKKKNYNNIKEGFKKLRTELFNLKNNPEELEKYLRKKTMDAMTVKDAVNFPVYNEIISLFSEEINEFIKILLSKKEKVHEKILDAAIFEYVHKFIRKNMLISCLEGNETPVMKKMIEILYNYYFEFLFKEGKLWEKIPYFINSAFLKNLRQLAFKNGIKRNEEMIKNFKKKYLLNIMHKIKNINTYDIKPVLRNINSPKAFNYGNKIKNNNNIVFGGFYNVTMSNQKINKEFVKNLEEFFYLNVETLNIPSYDSLVSLSREYGKDKVNIALKENINGIKEKIKDIDFQKTYFDFTKSEDAILYRNDTNNYYKLKRFIFYNYDKTKKFLINALKDIEIDVPEYNKEKLEDLIKKVQMSLSENIEFAPAELKILEKAEELLKEKTDINEIDVFIKKAGLSKESDIFNFSAVFQRKLVSLLDIYFEEGKENEILDLKKLSSLIEQFLKKEINEEDLKNKINSLFMINGKTLRETFVSLSENLKNSVNIAEIKTAFLIEDVLNDIYTNDEISLETVLDKIKNEDVKKAILTYDTSFLNGKLKEKTEEFLYKGKIDALEEILNIEKKTLQKEKFQSAGFIDRNPLVKSFKNIIKASKNILRNDMVLENEKEKLLEIIKQQETDFYYGNLIFKLERDYIFEEIEKNFFRKSNKGEFYEFLEKVKKDFGNEITISTKEIEKLLEKQLLANDKLNTKETMKLFIYSKILYPKLSILQGNHDKLRSNGAFLFFTIKNEKLRYILNHSTFNSFLNMKIDEYLFADINKYTDNKKIQKQLLNLFKDSIYSEGLSNSLKYILNSNYKEDFYKRMFDGTRYVNKEINHIDGKINEDRNSLIEKFDNEIKNKVPVISELIPNSKINNFTLNCSVFNNNLFLKKFFGNKDLNTLSKEEIRNYLLESVSFPVQFKYNDSSVYFITNKLIDLFESLEESEKYVSKFYFNFIKRKKELKTADISEINKILKKDLDDEEVLTLRNALKTFEQINKSLEDILNFSEDESFKDIKSNLLRTKNEIEKIINIEYFNFIENFEDNIKTVLKYTSFLKKFIDNTIENFYAVNKGIIKNYVNKIKEEGWDYKDIISIKEYMAYINFIIKKDISAYNFINKDNNVENNFSLKYITFLIQNIMNSKEIDQKFKDIITLYYVNQVFGTYNDSIGLNDRDKYIKRMVADKNNVKELSKSNIYLNLSELNTFSDRLGEFALMPEMSFLNRGYAGTQFFSLNDIKVIYYPTIYNFDKKYDIGEAVSGNFINIDALRKRINDIFMFFKTFNDNKNKYNLKIKKGDSYNLHVEIEKEGKKYFFKIPYFPENNKGIYKFFSNLLENIYILDNNNENEKIELSNIIKMKLEQNNKDEIYFSNINFEIDKKSVNSLFFIFEDMKKISNFYFLMNTNLKKISEQIKKDPKYYIELIDTLKNVYDETIQREIIKIADSKKALKNKIKEIQTIKKQESYILEDYYPKLVKEELNKIKFNFSKFKNNITKFVADYSILIKNKQFVNQNIYKLLKTAPYSYYFTERDELKEIRKTVMSITKNENILVKEISDNQNFNFYRKEFFEKRNGVIDINEKNIYIPIDFISGKEKFLNNKEYNKNNIIPDDMKKFMNKSFLLKNSTDFNFSHKFEKIKNEYLKTFKELTKELNKKEINNTNGEKHI